MTSLLEIETAIKNLPENDTRQLSEWLQTYVADQWDQQIETDLIFGKLDDLIAHAEQDISKNKVKELNKILKDDRNYLFN